MLQRPEVEQSPDKTWIRIGKVVSQINKHVSSNTNRDVIIVIKKNSNGVKTNNFDRSDMVPGILRRHIVS